MKPVTLQYRADSYWPVSLEQEPYWITCGQTGRFVDPFHTEEIPMIEEETRARNRHPEIMDHSGFL